MPSPQALDAILRTVDPKTPVDPSCQVLVPIDTRTGQIARQGFLSVGSKHRKHLLITNSHGEGAVAVRRDLKIGVEDFSRDCRFELVLDYEARCSPGREVRVAQALWNGPSSQDRLEALLKSWVLHRLDGKAGDFVHDFSHSADSLAEELRNRAFEQTGLSLAVRVRLAEADRFEPLKEVKHRFSHSLRDYPKPVEVNIELLLQLSDPGCYVRAKAPDLQAWARREVQETTIRCLFGVTYTDLCLHYEQKKSEIEQRMKEKAAAIGYELKQLITITDLQLDLLRRPFLVRLEGEFATRVAKLKVRLEVNATLVVPHPSEIAALLDRRVDVREQIRATLVDRIQQKLHDVDPESFYMEFETAREEGRQPVRSQLETVIRRTVKEEFRAEVLSLSCKQLETEFSLRLERLMKQRHEFWVEVEPSRGGPVMVFQGSFRVTGVDERGWIAFQTSNPEPEDLCSCAKRHLRYLLADEETGRLVETPNASQREKVEKLVQERFLEEFGIRVRMMDWARSPHDVEKKAADVRLKLATRRISEQEKKMELATELQDGQHAMQVLASGSRLEQLTELQRRLTRALVAGDSPEEVKELREKIASLEEEQKKALAEATADRANALLPELRSARDILTEGDEETPQKGKGKSLGTAQV